MRLCLFHLCLREGVKNKKKFNTKEKETYLHNGVKHLII